MLDKIKKVVSHATRQIGSPNMTRAARVDRVERQEPPTWKTRVRWFQAHPVHTSTT